MGVVPGETGGIWEFGRPEMDETPGCDCTGDRPGGSESCAPGDGVEVEGGVALPIAEVSDVFEFIPAPTPPDVVAPAVVPPVRVLPLVPAVPEIEVPVLPAVP